MHRAFLIFSGVGAAALLSGCVAAVLPVLAAGTMVRSESMKSTAEATPPPPVPVPPQMAPMPAAPRADYVNPIAVPSPALAASALPSGYQALVDHVRTRAALAAQGAPVTSLVLENALTLREPAYVDCEGRTPAVLIDLDDAAGPVTAMTAQPGESAAAAPAANADMVAALRQLRATNTRVIWITDLPDSAATTIGGWLHRTGLDPESNDTLYAAAPGLERKQLLRRRAAEQFCIIAVVGDKKSDAEEAYDYLRNPDAPLIIDANWGSGWFLLPLFC